MEDDEKGGALNTNMNGLLKIAIFSMVAVIIVATVAVPILANVGTTTTTEYNTGAKITFADRDYFSGIIDDFDSAENVRLILNQDGFGMTGEVDGESVTKIALPISQYDTRYPIVINGVASTQYSTMYTYNPETQRYIVTDINGITEVEWTYIYPITTPQDMPIWAQTTKGDQIISTSPMKFTEDDLSIFGITIQVGKILITGKDTNASLITKVGSSSAVTTFGEPIANVVQGDDWSTLKRRSFNVTTCQYIIGPSSVSYSENYIDGTQIGTLISIIPILIIAGIIVAIIKGKGMSDR